MKSLDSIQILRKYTNNSNSASHKIIQQEHQKHHPYPFETYREYITLNSSRHAISIPSYLLPLFFLFFFFPATPNAALLLRSLPTLAEEADMEEA